MPSMDTTSSYTIPHNTFDDYMPSFYGIKLLARHRDYRLFISNLAQGVELNSTLVIRILVICSHCWSSD
jgi:hypothetical protein